MIPLTDGPGLYTDGNEMPADYLEYGMSLASTITKVDAAGNPSPAGKLVVAALNGMSNANQEFKAFTTLFRGKYGSKRVALFNGNRGGWDLSRVIGDVAGYWEAGRGGVMTRLAKQSIAPAQVQVAWMKNSIRGLNLSQQGSADLIQAYWNEALANTLRYLPNIKLFFVSSAIYSGYALRPLPRKEPQAFYEGYGVKQLVEQHILSHRSGGNTSFVAWGPYLWANGTTPRGDGLIWEPGDFEAKDGVHPGPAAEAKVANMLLNFFETDPTTKGWILP